jgi:hypothetical protein
MLTNFGNGKKSLLLGPTLDAIDNTPVATNKMATPLPLPPPTPQPPPLQLTPPYPPQHEQGLRILSKQPINPRCLEEALSKCVKHAIRDLFFQSPRVRYHNILFLYDVVKQTNSDTHLELSRLGLLPKLLDFVRVNEENEQLEVSGERFVERHILIYLYRDGIKIFKALARLASNSKVLLTKSEKHLPKS